MSSEIWDEERQRRMLERRPHGLARRRTGRRSRRPGLEAVEIGSSPSKKRFEFNQFEITIDAEKNEAVLVDVLDATDAGKQTMVLQDLEKGLRRLAEAQLNDTDAFPSEGRDGLPAPAGGGKMSAPRYACPCCGFLTLRDEPPGTFAICPVCFWEDDDAQFNDQTYAGGANRVSLSEARKNFSEYGAVTREFRDRARAPLPVEMN